MVSLLAARSNQLQRAEARRSVEARERIQRALKIAVEFAVERDVFHFWLRRLMLKQKLSTDAVTVSTKWIPGWAYKNVDPLYKEALSKKLGEGFSVGVRTTAILRRPYLEVSYIPQEVGYEEFVAEPSGA